jgi:hypothetical protein
MAKRLFDNEKKWCPGCKDWRPLEEFYNCRSSASGKKSRCKKHFQEQNAPHMRKYLYGLSDAEVLALWEEQGRKCIICQEPIPLQNRHLAPIDLDPATGEVRGMLCARCNWGLGSFRDNQTLLQAAIKYLRRFELKRKELRGKGIKTICSSHASHRQRTGGTSGPAA